MPKNIVIAILLLFTTTISIAQKERTFTEEQLREDLKFLKEGFETYGPNLGVFHPKEDFIAVYDSLSNSLQGSMTDLEFFPYVARLAAANKEGHTILGASPDTITSIFRGFTENKFDYFPILLVKPQDKTRVWANLSSDSTLQPGDQLLKINGKTIESILQHLEQYAITDGDIPNAKTQKVLASFSRYYYWFYERPEHYEIAYQPYQSNKVKKTTVPAAPLDSLIAWRDRRYGKPEVTERTIDDVYEFKIEEGIGILTLKSFNRGLKDRFKINTKKLYKSIFKELEEKSVQNLIIDLRDNNGGREEYTKDILPYLLKEPIDGIAIKSTSWEGKQSTHKLPKPSKWAFQGKIYVLTNVNSFSNGSVIPALAKEYANATIVGGETSSRYEGFAAGSQQYITLPNTKLSVRIPRYLREYPHPNHPQKLKNRGVLPHYPVTYSFADLQEKRDKTMEKAMELIKQ